MWFKGPQIKPLPLLLLTPYKATLQKDKDPVNIRRSAA